jgi:hypothetical protein
LVARLERMERLLRPQERVHVIEVPVTLIHDEDAVAQLLTAKGIYPNEGDLVIRFKVYLRTSQRLDGLAAGQTSRPASVAYWTLVGQAWNAAEEIGF